MEAKFAPQVEARHRLIHELDPNHPTWIVLDKPKDVGRYVSACDIVGMDPYPIGRAGCTIDLAGRWTRLAREATCGERPLWQVPQCFDWSWFRRKDNEHAIDRDARMPTRQEMRSMVWQMVAEGANGLMGFCFHRLKERVAPEDFPAVWEDVCTVFAEVRARVPTILSDPAEVSVRGEAGVSFRAWAEGERTIVLLVNATLGRRKASVDGRDVRLDPLEVRFETVGSDELDLAGTWHVAAKDIAGDISMPGTLCQAKLGRRWTREDFRKCLDYPQQQALVQEFQYVGKAAYTRKIVLSEQDCAGELELFLDRVMWESRAFFDGRDLGAVDSLGTPHVHRIPHGLATPGEHEVRIVVDNSRRYGFSRYSHSYGPSMQAVWNGVLGRIAIRRAHPLRGARVFAEAPARGRLRVEVPTPFAASRDTVSVSGLGVAEVSEKPSPFREGWKMLTLALDAEPECWDEFHPALYTLTLRDAATGFTHSIRFGFRTIAVNGRKLMLNGRELFLRGNIENANFAHDGLPWTDKADWLRMFRTLKEEDGINMFRFHSWAPPQAAFDAADELGILLAPEAGIWSDRWMTDVQHPGYGGTVDGFVQRELAALVDAYGNSPSFFSLGIGNELGASNFDVMGEWIAAVKKHDPRRLYFASTARKITAADDYSVSHVIPGYGLCRERLYPHTDWDYTKAWAAAKLPTVAHEIGQWPVFPIYEELLPKFTGSMRPWNLTRHYDTAKRNGTLRFEREYHVASAKLNRLIYKEEVESFLRTRDCAGLELLNVQDFTGQCEALVGWRDPFYDLKSGFTNMPPFSTVWGRTCYLARFPKFVWTVGEKYEARLQLRNLGDSPIPAGTDFPYDLAGQKGNLRLAAALRPGDIADLGVVSIPLVTSMTKEKQTLRFGRNSWNFWVFPKEDKCQWPDGVVETADVDEMKKALAAGCTVVYRGGSFQSSRSSVSGIGFSGEKVLADFRPVYWSAKWFPAENATAAKLGTWFDVSHPVFAGFPTEDFTDWQWFGIVGGVVTHRLCGLPADYRPFALSVSDFHFAFLAATMFEVKVGKGRLFVCGYDLDRDNPETKRLRASIAAYLSGSAVPSTPHVDIAWLDRQFVRVSDGIDLSQPLFDETPKWSGTHFTRTVSGLAPRRCVLRFDFSQPGDTITSAKGLVDGHDFHMPLTRKRGDRSFAEVDVDPEDLLDGKLEIEIRQLTGQNFNIDRVRVVPR